MPRRFLKRYLPDPARMRRERSLRVFGDALYDPNLWHLNRHSAALAAAVGLFCAFIPVPMQMILAALVAVWLRCNLPIAVILVWITNPVTIPPIFLFTYSVGAMMLGREIRLTEIDLSLEWLTEHVSGALLPLLLGSLTVGLIAAGVGYLATLWIWRFHVIRRWQERLARRRAAREASRIGEGERPQ